MGIGRTNAGGGGSGGLNFKVVGGTVAPNNPKENTIWVNTDTAISEWVFSATQPASPTAGMVWFQTSTSANTPFNALKKNNITVYPTACKQYVSGAWVSVDVKTYQRGAWIELWHGEIVDGSVLPRDFELHSYIRSDASDEYVVEMSDVQGGLYIKTAVASSSYTTGYILPKIDLSDYSKLTVTWKAHGYVNVVGFVSAIKEDNTSNQNYVASTSISKTGNAFSDVITAEIDVSALNGEYIFAATTAGSHANQYRGEIVITQALLS